MLSSRLVYLIYIHIFSNIHKCYMYTFKYAFKPTGGSNSTTLSHHVFDQPFSIQDSLGSLVTELMALTLVPLGPGPGYGAGRLLVSTTFFDEGDEDEDLLITLQGTNISHLGKRKIIFKSALGWDMLISKRVIINFW